jgi:endoglucanase
MQAEAWRDVRPADAARMDVLASRPAARWYGDWSGDVRAAVSAHVDAAQAAGAMPLLVAYDIPFRDCGSHSSGGARGAAAYRAWIRALAAGIGDRAAAVIVEPDALAGIDCLPPAGQRERLSLVAFAVAQLAALPRTAVYVDAGNPGWVSAGDMARRLRAVGVSRARGFAVNVSSFFSTADARAFGDAISARVGRKPFVVDTSRSGAGPHPAGEWCNPSGRHVGPAPAVAPGSPGVDAYLWIKRVGESDGACRGGPPAGTWWPQMALELAGGRQRAAPVE